MGAETSIAWCDATFNPWIGCTKVSPGCAHCYAETLMDTRYGRVKWGKGNPRSRTSASNWKQPLKWNREAAPDLNGPHPWFQPRPRVFCGSLCDWLDDEVPIKWLADLLDLIHHTPNLDWLLLTKRPQNWHKRMAAVAGFDSDNSGDAVAISWLNDEPHPNVWIGTSVEDQQRADERIQPLLSIPAKVRFLSCEPLLGPVDLAYSCFNLTDSFGTMPGIHWVIIGGESGPKARPLDPEWVRSLIEQCRAAGVAPFVKQLGEYPILDPRFDRSLPGRARRLRDRKGGDMDEFPIELRIREFPI